MCMFLWAKLDEVEANDQVNGNDGEAETASTYKRPDPRISLFVKVRKIQLAYLCVYVTNTVMACMIRFKTITQLFG